MRIVASPICFDGGDLKIELLTVGELDDFGAARVRSPSVALETRWCASARVSCGRASLPTLSGRRSCPDAVASCAGSGKARSRLLQGRDSLGDELHRPFTQPIRAEPRVCCQVRPRK